MNINKEKKFIFVLGEAGTPMNDVFSDLSRDKRAEVIEISPYIKNPFLRLLRKVHCSARVNSIVKLPFRDKWHNALDDIEWKQNVEYHIVFISYTFAKRPVSFWYNLKRKYDVKYSLYLLSANESYVAQSLKMDVAVNEFNEKVGFENILTTQPGDAEKYGYIFCNYCFSVTADNISDVIENDLYLLNAAKGRLKVFHDVYAYVRQNNVKSKFRIIGVKKKDQIYPDEIIYNKSISFKENIKEIKRSNCIFEVLGEGQSSESIHYFEAVCYNKKLLTDNKNVVNLPFYNPEYIHVFEKPEDIDCEWIKEQIPIDYHYDGRYSPKRFIDKIVELEEGK